MKRHLFGMSIVYQMEWIDWHKNSSHALAHKCWGRREMRLPNRKKIEIWCPYDSCAYQFTCSYQVRWKSVKGQWSWTSWRNAMHHIPDKKYQPSEPFWCQLLEPLEPFCQTFFRVILSPLTIQSTCRISLQRSQRYTQKHLHPSITTITLSVSCWQQEMPSMTRSQLKIRQLGSVTSLHRHYLNTNNNDIYIDNALWKVTNSTQAKMLRKSTTVSISMGHSINRHFEPHLCDWYRVLWYCWLGDRKGTWPTKRLLQQSQLFLPSIVCLKTTSTLYPPHLWHYGPIVIILADMYYRKFITEGWKITLPNMVCIVALPRKIFKC